MEKPAASANLMVALLAAGYSRRFGHADKLAADLGGRPVLAWAAAAGLTVNAPHHVLVTSHSAHLPEGAAGYRTVVNPSPEQGMASSLRIAAKEAQDTDASALLILLADTPFIEPDHLRKLVASASANPSRAVFTRAPTGIPQPPAIFPARLFPDLSALEGDQGARSFARDALFVEADEAQLLDIDRQEDLETARGRLRPV